MVSKYRHGPRNINSKDMVDKRGNSYFYDTVLQQSEWRQRQDQQDMQDKLAKEAKVIEQKVERTPSEEVELQQKRAKIREES